jgi:diguanylate cyclase
MRYTWRVILTLIILFGNGLNDYFIGKFSFKSILSILFSSAIGWLIGHQIDHYRFSKKELCSTKTVLINYSFALDSVGEAIGITNEFGHYEFVNESCSKLYGYSKEEFLTLTWNNCYAKETVEYLTNIAVPKLLETGYWKGEVIGVRKDGSTFPQEISLSLIKDSKKTICIVRDITVQKMYEASMKYVAEHNDLTNLPNRRRLLDDLACMKENSKNTSLLFIDLDRFKLVNDHLGHDKGDELLKNVANRLLSFKNEFVHVYHHGGDEFIIIIENTDVSFIKELANQINKKLKEPYDLDGNEVIVTASIGISLYPDHTQHINNLIKTADTAMYYAKLDGKDTFKFFNKELELQLERKSMIESELRKAIQNDELFIVYQPKFQMDNFEIVGIEALIRWNHPCIGMVSPEEFIPIAEESGLILNIGKWVIHEVLHQIRKWLDQGYPCCKVSVNVSPRQFRDKELVHAIRSSLHEFHIDSKLFEIEITESVIEDTELIIPILQSLKAIGVGISIDDFGTGYSSLNILKDLPIDTLKIDQSFIRDLLGNPKDNLLVKSILQIGQTLGLKVVAEGIETEEQLQHLKSLNCLIGQGYIFSKPIKAAELEKRFFLKNLALHT